MVLDHIGVVVPSLEEGIQSWEKLFGYHQNSDVVLNTRQKLKIVFLSKADSLPLKLVEPSEPSSPIFAFAARIFQKQLLTWPRKERILSCLLSRERRSTITKLPFSLPDISVLN